MPDVAAGEALDVDLPVLAMSVGPNETGPYVQAATASSRAAPFGIACPGDHETLAYCGQPLTTKRYVQLDPESTELSISKGADCPGWSASTSMNVSSYSENRPSAL